MRVNSKYDEAFRTDAVELVLKGERPISKIAEDLGVNEWTLRGWYYKHPMVKRRKKAVTHPGSKRAGGSETAEERLKRLERDNERLRKENDALRTDREILKKAAAFFAKENE
jgi:transposase